MASWFKQIALITLPLTNNTQVDNRKKARSSDAPLLCRREAPHGQNLMQSQVSPLRVISRTSTALQRRVESGRRPYFKRSFTPQVLTFMGLHFGEHHFRPSPLGLCQDLGELGIFERCQQLPCIVCSGCTYCQL